MKQIVEFTFRDVNTRVTIKIMEFNNMTFSLYVQQCKNNVNQTTFYNIQLQKVFSLNVFRQTLFCHCIVAVCNNIVTITAYNKNSLYNIFHNTIYQFICKKHILLHLNCNQRVFGLRFIQTHHSNLRRGYKNPKILSTQFMDAPHSRRKRRTKFSLMSLLDEIILSDSSRSNIRDTTMQRLMQKIIMAQKKLL